MFRPAILIDVNANMMNIYVFMFMTIKFYQFYQFTDFRHLYWVLQVVVSLSCIVLCFILFYFISFHFSYDYCHYE